jgi:hypothetical protein
MENDWRTIQLFLTDDGVCEVEADHNSPYVLQCSCRASKKFNKCAHIKHVRAHMETNDGHYTVQITANIDPLEAAVAIEDAKAFRDFIIKYGKVEVL